MKTTELMIGDWVRIVDDDTDQSFDTRITGVSGLGNIYAPLPEGEHAYPFSVDCIEPIPLTSEILEKNGFRWTGGGDSSKMFSTPWGYDGIRYNLYVGLKKKTIEVHAAHPELRSESWRKVNKVSLEVCGCYVHELQHALRLCGIEKEVVL